MNKKPENMGDRELCLRYSKHERELQWLRKVQSKLKKEMKKRYLTFS